MRVIIGAVVFLLSASVLHAQQVVLPGGRVTSVSAAGSAKLGQSATASGFEILVRDVQPFSAAGTVLPTAPVGQRYWVVYAEVTNKTPVSQLVHPEMFSLVDVDGSLIHPAVALLNPLALDQPTDIDVLNPLGTGGWSILEAIIFLTPQSFDPEQFQVYVIGRDGGNEVIRGVATVLLKERQRYTLRATPIEEDPTVEGALDTLLVHPFRVYLLGNDGYDYEWNDDIWLEIEIGIENRAGIVAELGDVEIELLVDGVSLGSPSLRGELLRSAARPVRRDRYDAFQVPRGGFSTATLIFTDPRLRSILRSEVERVGSMPALQLRFSNRKRSESFALIRRRPPRGGG